MYEPSPGVTHTLLIPLNWHSEAWVFSYAYSDSATNSQGFGAFAPDVGAEWFDMALPGTTDLAPIAATHHVMYGFDGDIRFTAFVRRA